VAKALSLQPDVMRGVMRVQGQGVPDGDVLVTRSHTRLPEPIRGGDFHSDTGGFIREDPETPLGVDLTYRATVTVDTRHIQSNRVLNPKAGANTSDWTAGAGRTLTRDTALTPLIPRDATTALRVSANPGAVASGIPERTLASTVPVDFGSGRWYVSGQMKYDSPDTWLWLDAEAAGTWQDVKNKGTWQDVKSTYPLAADQPFASLWCAVLSPANAVVVAPFQIIGVSTLAQNTWQTFQGWVDVPGGAPAGSRLVFLHGEEEREFATTFWLTTVMVTPEAEADTGGAVLPYFDGDSVLPVNPAANLVPGFDWFPVINDAAMTWSGAADNSASVYTGPSVIAAETTSRIDAPGRELLPRHRLPMMLSDPILPQVSVWFELVEIGDLGFAARQDLYDVVGRGPRIAVGSQRAWAEGEFRLATYTLQAAAVAERMFSPGRILFLRNPDPDFPETYWYLAIGNVTQGRVGPNAAKKPERIWRVPFVRVERPVGLIAAASGITWQNIKTGYTWAELRQERQDWLDAAVTPA
jgi:hypothetical protein